MKKIEAIIKPFKLDEVKNALNEIGIHRIIAVNAKSFDDENIGGFRGAQYAVDYAPKIKLEILAPDNMAEKAVGIVAENARTGREGDGVVYISAIESAFNIFKKQPLEKPDIISARVNAADRSAQNTATPEPAA